MNVLLGTIGSHGNSSYEEQFKLNNVLIKQNDKEDPDS